MRTKLFNISVSSFFVWVGRLLFVSILVSAFFVIPIAGRLSIAAAFILVPVLSFYTLRLSGFELLGLGFIVASLSLGLICLGSGAFWPFQPYLSVTLFAGGIWAYILSARRPLPSRSTPSLTRVVELTAPGVTAAAPPTEPATQEPRRPPQ